VGGGKLVSGKSITDLLAEFNDGNSHVYTHERFEADRKRLLERISTKHGIPESDVERLIREHDYEHSGEDPEDEYIGIMAFAHHAGWL
jgi:hypothetical protein